MATIKKPVIISKPASVAGSIKQTSITTLAAKKPLKPDTVLRKTPIPALKVTSLANKALTKPVVSKMAPTKVITASVDKAAVSLKPTPVKSSNISPPKPVLVKATIKRAVADSTSSDKDSQPARKLSIPTGLTKSTKVVTKPTASSLTPAAKVSTAMTKSLTDKSPAKPVAEKLPAKAKLTSSTPLKASSAMTKLVTTSALAKRPLTPKIADIKKPAMSRPTLTKSISKTVSSVVKPPSIITPIAGKKDIKKCTEVQICDADSTSVTMNDQLEMVLGPQFGTATPEASSEFNEIQAYKVAEQMMEVLRTSAATNEVVLQDSLLQDSVVIDMSALEVSAPTDEELAASVEVKVSGPITDCEPARQVDSDSRRQTVEDIIPDLISFGEVDQEDITNGEPTAEDSSEGVADVTAVNHIADDATAESSLDQDEGTELSLEDQVGESEIPSDEAEAGSGDEGEPTEEMTHNEQIFVDEEQGEATDEMLSTADPEITHENDEDHVSPANESQPEQPVEMTEEVIHPATSIDIQENHFYPDADPAPVNANPECICDDFVVVGMVKENVDEDLEQVPLIANDWSAMEAEKFADTESVASAGSTASYADVVKQPATECAGEFEAFENEEVEEDKSTCQQVQDDNGNLSVVTVGNEEQVSATAEATGDEAIEAAEDAEATGDTDTTKATEDAQATEVSENAEAAADVVEKPTEEQVVKVEPLLGSMADEVQQELDAGMEHSHTADEEGYMKVQKKRNKRNNKRNRKSLKAFQKENTGFEPQAEVQETQDDLQVIQKRRNSRRAKNSMKKPNRRFSEPYSNSHCYSTPVWKSYYVEH